MGAGPLAGIRIVEVKGLGPGPYAGMLLADLGAEVVVVERASQPTGIGPPSAKDVHARGKRSIALDLKNPAGVAALLRIVDGADALIEGFRPGVAERLGFGPDVCLARNGRLVYGRVTGWGQEGPLAKTAGHDLNYIALTGTLAAIGRRGRPAVPLNLVGDYAGGSLFLALGVLAALIHARASGQGQVIDAAITDGAASLMSLFHGLDALGLWSARRESNLLDGAAPGYDVYETADGRFVALAALEPAFFDAFAAKAGLDLGDDERPLDPARWDEIKPRIAALFRTRTQAQWCALFDGTDACVAPVLSYREAPQHPHNAARGTYVEIGGCLQPAPAPRFSATPSALPAPPPAEGADTDAVLADFGFSDDDIAALRASGALT